MRLLVSRGADVNVPDRDGGTALTFASKSGHLEIVRLLVEHGADLNARDHEGDTPVMCAINGKSAGIINFLISRGADLTIMNKHNKTALDLASEKGLLRIVNDIKFRLLERQKQVS